MSRELLVQEIRSLEGDLEHTHELNLKQTEEIEILQRMLQDAQAARASDEGDVGNAAVELPMRSGNLHDELAQHPGAQVVTLVDGKLHAIITDSREVVDQASQVHVLYDELSHREVAFEEIEEQNARLCDLVDEVQTELQEAKQEVVVLQEAVAAGPSELSMPSTPVDLEESLGDMMDAAAAEMGTHGVRRSFWDRIFALVSSGSTIVGFN
jgi:hypothetical protein